MGASDWAGRMSERLEQEFGTTTERNSRITSLIRWFSSKPEYEDLFDGNRSDEWRMLTNDLPDILREQSGNTIEERWNSLMDELGYQELVEGGVYLRPWQEYDETTYAPDVSHSRIDD